MDGDYDDNFYFNNPVDYVAGLSDPWYLERAREGRHPARDRHRAVGGSGADATGSRRSCRPGGSGTRWTTGAPTGGHDWPFWKRQMNEYVSRLY